MIKRTLYFGNPGVLNKKDLQLVYTAKGGNSNTIPIEDVGFVVLDNKQLSLSHALISALIDNNAAIMITDEKHLPTGLLMSIYSHHAFTEKLYNQLESSQPLKKNLWQQTIVAKITNQAALLDELKISSGKLQQYIKQVNSGDTRNIEGRAAAYYWDNIFGKDAEFLRSRTGDFPNSLLNYGYAILLAIVARSLIASGLLPAFGIHHRNKYNPWCLASDIMEPYRPFVDRLILEILKEDEDLSDELNPTVKKRLLAIPALDIFIEGKRSPLMVGVQRTTASLASCFEGSSRKILYPLINDK